MLLIGGTNHGRWDDGGPSKDGMHYRIPTFDLAGYRNFQTEVYHRCDGYWRHESLSDEQFVQSVAASADAKSKRALR